MSQDARVYYNKLVRDNIPAKITAKGETFEVRTITDPNELQQELLKKIHEEASSLAKTRDKKAFIEEYCDLQIVLETLLQQLQISKEELERAQKDNLAQKGAYTQAHFLHWSADMGYQSNESTQGIRLQ